MSDAKKAKTEGPTTRELDRTGVYPGLSSPNTQRWPSHTSFTHALHPHTDPTNQKRLRMRRRWLLRLQL